METSNHVPAASDFLGHWNNMIKIAKDTLLESQDQQTKYANQYRHHLEFNIGDKVLLSTKNINNPVDKNRPTKKLAPKFIGPYTISKINFTTAYKLDLSKIIRIYLVFHVSLLKPYKESPEEFARLTPPPAIFIPE